MALLRRHQEPIIPPRARAHAIHGPGLSVALLGAALAAFAADPGSVSEAEIEKIVAAIATSDSERNVIRRRLTGWRELQVSPQNKALGEADKLRLVNDFVHETPFFCDPVMWCAEDFWSRPVEFLANDGGALSPVSGESMTVTSEISFFSLKRGITGKINSAGPGASTTTKILLIELAYHNKKIGL